MGLPAGSEETVVGAIGSGFAGVAPGVERAFPIKGKGRFIAWVRG